MPHFITDKCIGCSVCEIKCPTNTIWGESKGQYYIHPERCIDCSVCGIYCPVDAIQNQHGELIPRIKPKDIPKAEVVLDLVSMAANLQLPVAEVRRVGQERVEVGKRAEARIDAEKIADVITVVAIWRRKERKQPYTIHA